MQKYYNALMDKDRANETNVKLVIAKQDFVVSVFSFTSDSLRTQTSIANSISETANFIPLSAGKVFPAPILTWSLSFDYESISGPDGGKDILVFSACSATARTDLTSLEATICRKTA